MALGNGGSGMEGVDLTVAQVLRSRLALLIGVDCRIFFLYIFNLHFADIATRPTMITVTATGKTS